ncbi:2-hydroxychromene-2-carboxylate isomerase [Pseudomonas sp. TCU-HL1]|uniref:2-hydroxychromene-2-carboxylate isomerase n=1 Tax=Pseudomonas sp. TCU-HL1 TaxID=1856685 RepID=UPI0008558C4F|nr:2-hydroxychromene-2-carboxylate isomerase [Pseudomonas sp. TCU-HL1]AOE82671.1 DSBA oxidoreductase [Pseudomonas sp. TCU-HL1]
MNRVVEFFFDFGSPTSYLASTQLPTICARAGASLIYRPIQLRSLFEATGNRSPVRVMAKGRYLLIDFQRFAKRYGVSLQPNPYFPIDTWPLLRAAVALQRQDTSRFTQYLEAMFQAIWVEGRNLNDPEVLVEVLCENDIDPITAQPSLELEAILQDNLDEAVEKGAFGVPTCFVGEQMFFGQDRLDFLAEELCQNTSRV